MEDKKLSVFFLIMSISIIALSVGWLFDNNDIMIDLIMFMTIINSIILIVVTSIHLTD